MIDFFVESRKIGSNKICLSYERMFWTAWRTVVLTCISNGSIRVITSKGFSPSRQLDIIKTLKVTHLYNRRSQLEACLKHNQIEDTDCSSVQRIITYGSKIRGATLSHFNRLFPNAYLVSRYGLTETGKFTF